MTVVPGAGTHADDGLAGRRRSYERASLALPDLSDAERDDPLLVLRRWLDEAVEDGRDPEPTAMVLATVVHERPGVVGTDARVVLCKGVDDGVVFYSNGGSAKGRQLADEPVAAVVFHWAALERQVRCRGSVVTVSREESDRYFASRPRAHQLGAWVSEQSRPIDHRESLERLLDEAATRFAGRAVPRPRLWGGYRLVPHEVELWQGRPSRLHDRLVARRDDDRWTWQRLQP